MTETYRHAVDALYPDWKDRVSVAPSMDLLYQDIKTNLLEVDFVNHVPSGTTLKIDPIGSWTRVGPFHIIDSIIAYVSGTTQTVLETTLGVPDTTGKTVTLRAAVWVSIDVLEATVP